MRNNSRHLLLVVEDEGLTVELVMSPRGVIKLSSHDL